MIIKAEVLLDRTGISPGVIDGRDNNNYQKAVSAFQKQQGINPTGKLDAMTFEKLTTPGGEPVMVAYEITPKDVEGPFESHIPSSMEGMSRLRHLAYRNPRQELAERYHMSEALLAQLNPGATFRAGTRILIANPGRQETPKKVSRILVNKADKTVSAFDPTGAMVAFYPASIGSKEKPAPSGMFKVAGVTRNPTYTYDPRFAFKGVKARHKITIRPGPNNPVGAVWIDLTAPSYGIHGTPAPDKIGLTNSHGCVRLTNWDALHLAGMVSRGTTVDFEE